MTADNIAPRVTTRNGEVVGRRAGHCDVFKGIPFARPPRGLLRFRPPEPVADWREPLYAMDFGPGPIQPATPMVPLPSGTSEDCLTLNIWAPVALGPHPVLFLIYGGGNVLGAANQLESAGEAFSKQGLVCVAANYRIGALGFMELGGIDPAYAGSSLNGLRDIEAALRWVHDNIACFGGASDQVTLLGNSAGAKNQCALAAMPSARGLFHRLSIMSGGGHTFYRSADEAMPFTETVLCSGGLDAGSVSDLLAFPADALLLAQDGALATFPQGFPFRPAVDGATLPQGPIDAARIGATAGLDMIIGTNRDEAALMLLAKTAEKPFNARQLAHLDLPRMIGLESDYAEALPNHPLVERRIRQVTAEEYWIPAVRFAEAHVRAGGRAWMYRFDWDVPGPLTGYAAHGTELPFVYDGAGLPISSKSECAARAAEQFHAMWARWARTGRVELEGTPQWPTYDDRQRPTLIFDRDVRIESDPHGDERQLWTDVI